MRWTATVQWVVAAAVFAPAAASPQAVRLELAPQLGVYVPVGALVKEGSPGNPSTLLEKRPEGSLLVGVKGMFWATKRVGIGANVTFSPSPVAVTDSLGTTDQTGGVLLASAQLLVSLAPPSARWFAHLGIGGGVVSRLGAVWDYASGAMAPTVVASVGAGAPLYPLGVTKPYPPVHVALRMEVADYISRTQFDRGLPTETRALTHHDFTISAMFSVPVMR